MTAPLLTRIQRAADPVSLEHRSQRDGDLDAAVLTSITRLLNTRQGSCLTCPDYGLIEISELVISNFPDAVGIIQRSLKATIQQYEPRLKNVQIRHVKSDDLNQMMFQFEITAQLHRPDGTRQSLRFATNIDGSGNVSLE